MQSVDSKPDVSVVMPAYNSAATIDSAIESALTQRDVGVEVIVVDDGSTDDTVSRARAHGARVRVISQANAGPQAARNRGINEARADMIAFLDSDDLWLPGKLSAQCRLLQNDPEVSAVFARWHVWRASRGGNFELPSALTCVPVDDRIDTDASGWLYTRLLLDVCMLTSTVMVRTQTLRDLQGFDPGLRIGEDYDLWLRLSRLGRIVKLGSVGTLYRVAAGSAAHRPHVRNWELEVVERALERWGVAGPDGSRVDDASLAGRLDQLRLQHAGMHLATGDARVALRGFTLALRQRPLRPRLWLSMLRALVKASWQPQSVVSSNS